MITKRIKLNIKPETHDKLAKLAEEEGRHIYKLVDLLIENYKENNNKKDN